MTIKAIINPSSGNWQLDSAPNEVEAEYDDEMTDLGDGDFDLEDYPDDPTPEDVLAGRFVLLTEENDLIKFNGQTYLSMDRFAGVIDQFALSALELINNIKSQLGDSEQERLSLSKSIGQVSAMFEMVKSMAMESPARTVGFLPLAIAATILDISEDRLRHLCYESKIASQKQGKAIFFRPEWISDYIKSGEHRRKLI